MSVSFNEEKRIFKLDSAEASYIFEIHEDGRLVHLYFGASIPDDNVDSLRLRQVACDSFSPYLGGGPYDGTHAPNMSPFEYPTTGMGDYRLTAYSTKAAEGNLVCDLVYRDHRIYAGKNGIEGLPATYVNDESEADTLEVDLTDPVTGAIVTLIYTAFNNNAAITRSVRVKNEGTKPFALENVASACVNLPLGDYDMITTHGRHAHECTLSRTPLGHMTQSISSVRGASGHSHNPFVIMPRHDTREECGDCYGFTFIYSGNYLISADNDYFASTRVTVGINPEGFEWTLAPGEVFASPEAVMMFSENGIGGVSRSFHRLFRKNLVRGKWRDIRRPLLINSWEAAYFGFDDDKLAAFAEKAATLGIEMLVMDDGWFGKRNDSSSSLGDWYVNENKLKGGLSSLIKRVNAAGLKFGIWYEPEMVSPDSDLYRAHPDWCIHTEGRAQSLARSQYMLDMSRPEVRDNVFEQMYAVLSENNIDYVKWDFNHNFTEASSSALSADRQGEFAHRYMLGTYELFDRLTKAFPDLLIESCSGGGGRFDAGMLYYSPQIWASDNTDAIDRLSIQFGTSMVYPASSMGAHVSAAARTPFATRAAVALWGTFGYELDPLRLSEEDCDEVRREVEDYHKYNELIRTGDLYRHVYPMEDLNRAAWSFVAEDKSEVLLTVVTKSSPLCNVFLIRLCGLDPDAYYREERSGRVFSGALLMKAGYNMSFERNNDGSAVMTHFVRV